jgi:hypothetical protein
MRIDTPVTGKDSSGRWRASARIARDGFTFDGWFVSDVPLEPSAEAFTAAALLPAMAAGEPLQVAAPLCSEFLSNIGHLQQIVAAWHPHLRPVTVEAREERKEEKPGRGAFSFFSGGVDAFSTALRHRAALTHLVLIRGFDISLDNDPLWTSTTAAMRAVADDLRLALTTVDTNIKDVIEPAGHWGTITHGAGLVSVGHILSNHFHTALISSTHHVSDLFPWGSHPLTDPLWSSRSLRFVHDGAHLTRAEKTEQIAQSDVAMRHLRVCYHQVPGLYNCGRCEKCVRTMVGLALTGSLSKCETLPHTIDPKLLDEIWVLDENSASFLAENLERARQCGPAEIREPLEYAAWSYNARKSMAAVRETLRALPLRTLIRRRLGW